MVWRVFAAAAVGSSHVQAGLPCQDAYAFQVVGDALLATVCDGAGSAASSHVGARLVSTGVVNELVRHLLSARASGSKPWPEGVEEAYDWMRELLSEVRAGLIRHAQAAESPLADFATTLVGVVTTPVGGWFFHVGDGVGVADACNGGTSVSQPENGEYANETYFITGEDWAPHLRLLRIVAPQRLALMSDGAASFVMGKGNEALFAPFITPVEKFLLATDEASGSEALARTLGDARTDRITPDDKTLLLAYA